MTKYLSLIAAFLLAAAPALAGEAVDYGKEGERLLDQTRKLFAGCENRFEGGAGNLEFSDRLEKYFAAAGVPCGCLRYESPVFIPGKASLAVGGEEIALHSFLPNGVDVCPFPEKEFSCKLVYVGKGSLEELEGKPIRDSLCLMDFDCDYNFLDVMPLGARGVIFIEPRDYLPSVAYQKVLNFPLTVPRYQVARADGEKLRLLADKAPAECAVKAEPGRWERRELKNHWAFIEGADPELKWELVVLHSHYDSLHYCPALPSGGEEAVNVRLLLNAFEEMKNNRPRRSALFLLCNSNSQFQAGAAEAAFHLFGPKSEIFNADLNSPSEERSAWREFMEREFIVAHYPRIAAGKVMGLLTEQYVKSGSLDDLRKAVGLGSDGRGERDPARDNRLQLWDLADAEKTLLDRYPGGVAPEALIVERIRSARAGAGEAEAKEAYATIRDCAFKAVHDDIAWMRENKDAKPAGRLFNIPELFLRQIEADDHALQLESAELVAGGAADPAKLEAIATRRRDIGRLVTLFNRFGRTVDFPGLSEEQKTLFESYRSRLVDESSAIAARCRLHLRRLDEVRRARDTIASFTPVLALGFNLSFGNESLGLHRGTTAWPNNFGDGPHWNKRREIINCGKTFINRINSQAQEIGRDAGVKWPRGRTDNLYLNLPPLAATQFNMQAVPAFDFFSPLDARTRLSGLGDTVDAVPAEMAARKAAFLREAVAFVMRDASVSTLRPESEGIKYRAASSAEVLARVQDGSSVSGEPKTLLKDGLVVLTTIRGAAIHVGAERLRVSSALRSGVYGYRLALSDVGGRAFLYNGGFSAAYKLDVYKLDDAMRVCYAKDMGLVAAKYEPVWDPREGFAETKILAAFACRKADIYDVYEPATLLPVGKPIFQTPMGGTQEDCGSCGLLEDSRGIADGFGVACLFLPEGQRAKVLFTGSVSLINKLPAGRPDPTNGIGYTAAELDRKSVALLVATDLARLNAGRIANLKDNAVTNLLMDTLHRRGVEWLEGDAPLQSLLDRHQYLEYTRRLNKAYGTIFSSYPVVTTTISDMMKAVIFYLAVLIPFSFFLQKLLFNFVRIEAQAVCFAAIFIVVYLIFYNIHPAFRIATNPQVVLIAFVMLMLAGFVSFALKGKFDYHMEHFKERFTSEDEVGILKLAGTAMLIGVTNMKRRKMRTALTCATIVLITFTMLSFTSVSQAVSPTRVLKGNNIPYTGVFFSNQDWQGLSPAVVRQFEEVVGQDRPCLQRGFKVYDTKDTLGVRLDGGEKEQLLQGILALQPEEEGWIGKLPITAGRFFSGGEVYETLVSRSFLCDTMAYNLKDPNLVPDDLYLLAGGIRLKVVGIFDGDRMASLRDLRGSSLVPQQMNKSGSDQQKRDAVSGEMPEGAFSDVGDREYIVVPFAIRNMFNIPVTSVSLKLESSQEVWNRVLEFAYYSQNKVYFGAPERFAVNPARKANEDPVYENAGRYYLGTGFETSVGGLSSLIIPLLVSATIIFNTMLGSVYERKKEIGIFNAVGLNPVHIALFFVAEAVVYGILGGVGGYLIGQLLAKAIVHFDLLSGINLNYSSLSVVYVILFTILIVIVSTIYPSLMAMRTASSSSGRKRVEKEDENRLRVQFPYSFTREMAVAVNSYLKEYFDKHADSSVGDFVAAPAAPDKVEQSAGSGLSVELAYDVALAPYDLGVTQRVVLRTRHNDKVGAFMVEAVTDRRSGQESNWLATNQPFLNGIRKYLLHWRVLSREGQEAHLREGVDMFGVDLER